jgi:hypothetical protein
VRCDQEAREAQQDRHGERRAGMAMQRHPSRDHRDHEGNAFGGAEEAEVANESVLAEPLNQVRARRPFGCRQVVHAVDQNPDSDSLQSLPSVDVARVVERAKR